jgi:hypothetical protein
MDRTGYSPIARRRYPSLFAVRDLAVSKSCLFLSKRPLDESWLLPLYRTDAARAEMVHGKMKVRLANVPGDKMPEATVLFPETNRGWGGWPQLSTLGGWHGKMSGWIGKDRAMSLAYDDLGSSLRRTPPTWGRHGEGSALRQAVQ